MPVLNSTFDWLFCRYRILGLKLFFFVCIKVLVPLSSFWCVVKKPKSVLSTLYMTNFFLSVKSCRIFFVFTVLKFHHNMPLCDLFLSFVLDTYPLVLGNILELFLWQLAPIFSYMCIEPSKTDLIFAYLFSLTFLSLFLLCFLGDFLSSYHLVLLLSFLLSFSSHIFNFYRFFFLCMFLFKMALCSLLWILVILKIFLHSLNDRLFFFSSVLHQWLFSNVW